MLLDLNNDSETEDRIKELKTIFQCVDAIEEINRDLSMFEEHLKGDDESLKRTAKTFTAEFSQCKEELEGQLNKLL